MRSHRWSRGAVLAAAVACVFSRIELAGAQVRPILQVGVKGQDTPIGGVQFDAFQTSPSIGINEQGNVYFFATLVGEGVVSTGRANNMGGFVWDAASGTTTLAIRRDDLAAGFPIPPSPNQPIRYGSETGTVNFASFLGAGSGTLDDEGNVTFGPILSGTGVTTTNDTAYYIGQPGSPVLVAREGDAIPASAQTGGLVAGQKYATANPRAVAANGNLIFLSDVTTSAGTGAAGSALFVGSGPNVTTVAYGHSTNGTVVAGERVTSIGTGRWTLDEGNATIFGANLTNTTDSKTSTALVTGTSAADLSIVAQSGKASPIAADVTYSTFDINDRSRMGNLIGFQATVAGAGVVTSGGEKNNTAFFLTGAAGGPLTTLVRENAPVVSAPVPSDLPTGATQMRFATLDNMKLSRSGWMLFSSQLRANNATSSSSTYDGLYVGRVVDGTAEVREVALERDTADFSQAALHMERTESGGWTVERWNGINGTATGINGAGEVVFRAGASVPGSSSPDVQAYFYYDPSLDRVFRLISEGDRLMVDPDGSGPLPAAARTVSVLSAMSDSDGGSDDGGRSIINDARQVVFRATYDGGEGVFVLDVDQYVPVSFHKWNLPGDGAWSSGTSWDVAAQPDGERTHAEFSSGITAPAVVTVDGPKTVGELYFENANKVTIAGTGPITLQGVAELGHIGVGLGVHEIAAPLVLADTTSVIINSNPTGPTGLTISGPISGAGGLRKGGPGTLTLTAANSYLGDTVLAAGYLEVGDSDQLGAATNRIVLDGGILRATAPITESRAIFAGSVVRDTTDYLEGGIDTGAFDVELSGPITFDTSSAGSDGYIYKTGAGTLTLSGSGGPGGIEVGGGVVEVTGDYLAWGNQDTRTLKGAQFVIATAGSIASTGGDFIARGGSQMTFGGPLTTAGVIQALFDSTDGVARVTINAPTQSGTMSVSSRGNTSVNPGQLSTIDVNADTTVSGTVTVSGSATNGNGVLDVAAGATFKGGTFAISGTVVLPAGATLEQTTAATSATAQGLSFSSSPSFDVAGTVKTAADLVNTGASAIGLNGPTTIGRDVRASSTAGGVVTLGGATTTVGRNVLLEGGTGANGTVLNISSPTTTVTGSVGTDADSNNETQNINFLAGSATVGSLLVNLDSTGTTALTGSTAITIASPATVNGGDVTVQANRTNASLGTGGLSGNATLNVAGTLDGGNLLMSTTEGIAGRNTATVAVNVTGTARVARVRQESNLGATPQRTPSIGTHALNVSGLLQVKANGTDAATSVLGELPAFAGPGAMDLANNDLIVRGTDLADSIADSESAFALVVSGRGQTGPNATKLHDGPGLRSSAAATFNATQFVDVLGLTAVRNGDLNLAFNSATTTKTTFGGVDVTPDDTLVRFGMIADLNFDNAITAQDYFAIDQAFLGRVLTRSDNSVVEGPLAGDLTGDGQVNASDYFLIDQAFLRQGGVPANSMVDFQRAAFRDEFVAMAFSMPAGAVPEPATISLLALGTTALLGRRRSSRRDVP